MKELRENEQFFFDQETLNHLTDFLKTFENPCVLCAPLVGESLEKQNKNCSILDIDERFSFLSGFQYFDIRKPKWISNEKFGIILCDPPFFNVKLSQLLKALSLLSHYDYNQPVLISYLCRREKRFLQTFTPYNLRPMGYYPSYKNINQNERNKIEFYGNISMDLIKNLRML